MNLTLSDRDISFAMEVYMRLKGYHYTEIDLHLVNGKLSATFHNISPSNVSTEQILQLVKERK